MYMDVEKRTYAYFMLPHVLHCWSHGHTGGSISASISYDLDVR